MADPKKPGLEIVLGMGGKPKGEPSKPMGDEPDDSMGGKVDAAQAVLEAIDMKDAKALSEALGAFLDLSDKDDGEAV